MKIKMVIMTAAIALVSIAATNSPSPLVAVQDCEPGTENNALRYKSQFEGVETYRKQVCQQAGTLALTFTDWVNGVLSTNRPANAQEITLWEEKQQFLAEQEAEANLSAEVESGKKAVEILREWSTQAMAIHESWPSLTPAQKDDRVRELFRRVAIEWDKTADDMESRGVGQ